MLETILIAAFALALGATGGILWARNRAAASDDEWRRQNEGLKTELHGRELALERLQAQAQSHEKALADQKQLLEASQKKLEDAFGNLSKAALRDNNQMFLQQADEKLLVIEVQFASEYSTICMEKVRSLYLYLSIIIIIFLLFY